MVQENDQFPVAETPKPYSDHKMGDVGVLFDGKYFSCDTRPRNMSKRLYYIDKMDQSAFRCITWSTKMGIDID
jgi:hypothetical protein